MCAYDIPPESTTHVFYVLTITNYKLQITNTARLLSTVARGLCCSTTVSRERPPPVLALFPFSSVGSLFAAHLSRSPGCRKKPSEPNSRETSTPPRPGGRPPAPRPKPHQERPAPQRAAPKVDCPCTYFRTVVGIRGDETPKHHRRRPAHVPAPRLCQKYCTYRSAQPVLAVTACTLALCFACSWDTGC